MKSERLLFVLVSLLLTASLSSCSGSTTPANNPILSPITTPILISTATLSPTSTLQPTELSTELPQETATIMPTQTEWLFQVTVTFDQLGPVGSFNWGILETRTPIQEGINPVSVSVLDPSGLGQMCAQGILVEEKPMVTSMIGGACLVEIPIP